MDFIKKLFSHPLKVESNINTYLKSDESSFEWPCYFTVKGTMHGFKDNANKALKKMSCGDCLKLELLEHPDTENHRIAVKTLAGLQIGWYPLSGTFVDDELEKQLVAGIPQTVVVEDYKTAASGSYNWCGVTLKLNIPYKKSEKLVYVAQTGYVYHRKANCTKSASFQVPYSFAINHGYSPCKKCVQENPVIEENGVLHNIPEQYVAFDTETTGLRYSDCIIEIGAVKVVQGKPVDYFSSFVYPTCEICEEAQRVNHITSDMLCNAPCADEVFPRFFDFIGDLPLIAHNAPFDFRFLQPQAETLGVSLDSMVYDSLALARSLLPELHSHKLSVLKETLHIKEENTHRALDDAIVLSKILTALTPVCEESEITLYSCSRYGNEPKRRTYKHFSKSVKVTKLTPTCAVDETHPLFGKSVVFTGELSLSRQEAAQLAVNAGARVRTSVSSKTDYLIVGVQDRSLVGDDGLSSKEEKAYQLIEEKNVRIHIINEQEFLKLIYSKEALNMEQLSMEPNSNEDVLKATQEIAIYNSLLTDIHSIVKQKNVRPEDVANRIGKSYCSIMFRKLLIFRIKVRNRQHYISVPSALKDVIGADYATKTAKSEPNFLRIEIDAENITAITPLVRDLVRAVIDRYPKEFDCCSRYLECSDAKYCIQPNPDIALGCGYKRILESGTIFYGKNRNVD